MSNRLAAEKSPYLRQHAENPVDWYPWGEEALAKARAEQKPIFLSIGYSTCHWCHVMAHESFEDAGIAAALNAGFVPVKVDREERPDLDRVYMTYVQQTTGHGGWPMSVWLTPDGKPFYGGTYFPPDDRHGRPGFLAVLKAITRHWQDQREKILTGADEVVKTLQRHAAGGADAVGLPLVGTPSGAPGASASDGPTHTPLHEAAGEAFEQGYQYFHDAFDAQWGGFGGAPKFPRASVVNFLFRIAALQGPQSELGADVVGMTTYTLQRMAEGGLHDHVGGGFHRYSVDNEWFVPHFEKMLYDQAQIALNYLEARQATGREVYAWIARGIFSYVQRELMGSHGGFYSAEDADSLLPAAAGESESESGKHGKHAEGAFYVWAKDEIDRVLGGGVPSPRGNDASRGEGTPLPIGTEHDAAFFCAHYGVKAEGNVAHDPQGEFTGKNILMQRRSLVVTAREFNWDVEAASVKLLACLEKLQAVRVRRPRPHLDNKVITAWNGLMISALAKGHQVLGGAPTPGHKLHGEVVRLHPSATARQVAAPYLAAATRAAGFIERELYDAATGTLYRSWCDGRSNIAGFAEDYAYLIQGLLDLYEAGFEIHWLQWAVELQAKMDALFWDPERGGYFNSRADDPTVIVRLKEDYDGAEPASNSVAALNLVRLDWMIGSGARPTPAAMTRGGVVSRHPSAMARQAAPPESSYRENALRTIAALRAQWSRVPHGLPQMLCAVELALTEPRTVVLAGDPRSADFQALAAVLHEKLGPRRALLAADGGAGQQWLAEHRPYLAEMKPVSGRATAYVCENYTCQQPVNEVVELRELLG